MLDSIVSFTPQTPPYHFLRFTSRAPQLPSLRNPSLCALFFTSVFCTVPRHQSFVGALAGTTSRFEISTARWRGRERVCTAVPPLEGRTVGGILPFPFPGAVESSSRAFALLDHVITVLNVLPLSGVEAIDLPTVAAQSHASREPPRRRRVADGDIFLTIGGRKPLESCPFVFFPRPPVNYYLRGGIVRSPPRIHLFPTTPCVFSFPAGL